MLCSVLSSSALACRTPEVTVPDNILEDFIAYNPDHLVQLYVHLGAGSDVLNGTTMFRFPFRIYANPKIDEWDPEVEGFKVYNGQTHISIRV